MTTSPLSFGRYVVIRELGSGGMARVYLARDPNLQRHVAIKAIRPEKIEDRNVVKRFFMEAVTAAKLNNPHIIEIHDFGDEGGVPYIVMEFINGPTLDEVITKILPNPLPQEVVVALICQAAEGLEISGQKGIVHRDIKPANLMITQQGYLKIMDFGIAHLKDLSITRTEGIIGPPAFMSPEQIKGIKPLSIQSDMFALGTLFYLCLTGEHPFIGESYGDIFTRVLHETPPLVCKLNPAVVPRLEGLVKTLLEKDPKKRGGGPKWLQGELQGILHQRQVINPVEMVSEYLIEMNTQGFTTTRLTPLEIDRAAKAFKGNTSRKIQNLTTKSSFRIWKSPSKVLALIGLVVLLGMGVRYGITYWSKPEIYRVRPSLKMVSKKTYPLILTQELKKGSPDISLPSEKAPTLSESPITLAMPAASVSKLNIKGNPHTRPQTFMHPAPVAPIETIAGECFLEIKTSPPFAEVYLDNKYLGVSPFRESAIPCGRHRLTMKTSQGTSMDTLVDFPGGTAQMRFNLDRNIP